MRLWGHFFYTQREKEDNAIPKIDLKTQNIRNLKSLVNRDELLKNMPVNAVVAEIGVDEGEFSRRILKITDPQKLHLIDSWAENTRYHIGLKSLVEDKFKKELSEGKVALDVGLSTSILKQYPDHYFDWVYLDTDHSYETTRKELAILKQKVKPDGIIAGHDYSIGNWISGQRYGVVEAVNEFCVMEKWEILFLTVETDQYRSFAIKQLK
jgi:hypothetical protein